MKQNYIPTINISSLVNKDLDSKESLKIIKKIEKAKQKKIIKRKINLFLICLFNLIIRTALIKDFFL